MLRKLLEWCIAELIWAIDQRVHTRDHDRPRTIAELDRKIRDIIEFLPTSQFFIFFCRGDKSHENFLETWDRLEKLHEQETLYTNSHTEEQYAEIVRVLYKLTKAEIRGHEQALKDVSVDEVDKLITAKDKFGYPYPN